MNLFFRRLIVTAPILALWLGAMAWLITQEAYPDLFRQTTSGYRSFLSQGVMLMDRWMIISFQGKDSGYSHTAVDVNEKDPVRHYQIRNQTILSLPIMGNIQRLSVQADATVDTGYALQTFAFSLSTAGYTIRLDGQRKQGREFDVRIRTAGTTQRLTVTIPDDAIIYSPMTEMTLKTLSPGQQVTLRVFNPVTFTSQNVTVRALRRESLRRDDHTLESTVLSATMDGLETLSWMDDQGILIRQQTPAGWAMESCDARKALSVKASPALDDMLSTLAVPIQGPVELLATRSSVRLRLSGPSFTRVQLQDHRQEVLTLATNSVDIVVRSDHRPPSGCPRDAIPADLAPWLAASAFIQAKDERLVSRAREITGDWTNSLEAATAIYAWVNTHVAKKPTVSLPSALDVLLRLEGDCNEHTYLFVGLARAAGLPARIRVGVTLHEGRFYYHAWPSVYVGQWLDMDPTRGLPAVNAGYIALVEGELAEQMKLAGMIGQLKVEVREPQP